MSKTDWPEKTDEIEKRNFIVDTSYFKRAFGWRPQIRFRQGVKNMIKAFSNP